MKTCFLAMLVSMIALSAQAEQQTRPVLGDAECHSIHAYFNTSPESPDGRFVLLFRSTTPDAHEGEVCIVERKSGEVRVLASGVTTEDGHRVACQQWSCGGREVVFHDLRQERWVGVAVNVASGSERILAEGRMVGWGQPSGETIPLYGPHWNPGPHRDLELLNVRTGKITKPLTADEVRSGHSEWVSRQFGERPISTFFPILSPDERRVLFKVATPDGGGFRSPKGSLRMGLVIYDLAERRFLPPPGLASRFAADPQRRRPAADQDRQRHRQHRATPRLAAGARIASGLFTRRAHLGQRRPLWSAAAIERHLGSPRGQLGDGQIEVGPRFREFARRKLLARLASPPGV
jgi:hypothetical protein